MAFVRVLLLEVLCLSLFITINAKAVDSESKEPATTPAQNTTEEVELEPLPNKFADYDVNEDGFLQYEEFTHAIMSVHPISDPSELRGMFELWDTNDDNKLDEKEFVASPLADDPEEDTSVAQFGWRCHYRCVFICRGCWWRCHCGIYVRCYLRCH